MKLETDLTIITTIAREKDDENWRFRSFLKANDGLEKEIDTIVHSFYKRISSEIDCKLCANCCRKIQPALNQKDIQTFSKGLGLHVDEFGAQYLVKGETPGTSRFNKLPCPFLKNNLCINYEHRPRDCSSFPHLHKRGFTHRLWNVVENYSICPIVFNTYEYLKDEIWQKD